MVISNRLLLLVYQLILYAHAQKAQPLQCSTGIPSSCDIQLGEDDTNICSSSEDLSCLLCHDQAPNAFTPKIAISSIEVRQNGNLVSALDPNLDITIKAVGSILDANITTPITSFKYQAHSFSICTGIPSVSLANPLNPTTFCEWSDNIINATQTAAETFANLFGQTSVDLIGMSDDACNAGAIVQGNCPFNLIDGVLEMEVTIKLGSFADGVGSYILNEYERLFDYGVYDFGFTFFTADSTPLACTRLVFPLEMSDLLASTNPVSTLPPDAQPLQCSSGTVPSCDIQLGFDDINICRSSEDLSCLFCHDHAPNDFTPKIDISSIEVTQNGIRVSALDPNLDITVKAVGSIVDGNITAPITSFKYQAHQFSVCTGIPSISLANPLNPTAFCDWSDNLLNDAQSAANIFTDLFQLTAVDITGASGDACASGNMIQGNCPFNEANGLIEIEVVIKLSSFAEGLGSYILNEYERAYDYGMYDFGYTIYASDNTPLFCTRLVFPLEISDVTSTTTSPTPTTTTPEPLPTTPAEPLQCSATEAPSCDVQPAELIGNICSSSDSLHCLLCHQQSPNNFTPKIAISTIEVSQNGNVVTTLNPNQDVTVKAVGTIIDGSLVTPITSFRYQAYGFSVCNGVPLDLLNPTCDWSADLLNDANTIAADFANLFNLTAMDLTGVSGDACGNVGVIQGNCPFTNDNGTIEIEVVIKINSFSAGLGSYILNAYEVLSDHGVYDFGFTIFTLDNTPLFCTRLVFPLEVSDVTPTTTTPEPLPTTPASTQCKSASNQPTCDLQTGGIGQPVLVDYCSPTEGIHCLLCHDTGSNPFSPKIDVTSVELIQNGNILTTAIDPNFDLTLRITGAVLNASYIPITAFKILTYGFSTCTGYPEGLITPTCDWSDDLLQDVQSTADDFTTLFNLTAVDVTGANNQNSCNPDGFIQANCPVSVEDGNMEMILQIKINTFAGGIGSSILNGLETLHDWGMNDIGFITYTLEDEPLFCTRIVAPIESSGATTSSTTTTSTPTPPAEPLQCSATEAPSCDVQPAELIGNICSSSDSLHCLLCHQQSPNNFTPKIAISTIEVRQNGNIVSALDPNQDITVKAIGTIIDGSLVTPITSFRYQAYGFSVCNGVPTDLLNPTCDWSPDLLSDANTIAADFANLFNLTAMDLTGVSGDACGNVGVIQGNCPFSNGNGTIEIEVVIKINSFSDGLGSYILNAYEVLSDHGVYDFGFTIFTLDNTPLFCTRLVFPLEVSAVTSSTTTPEPSPTTPATPFQCKPASNLPTCDLQTGGIGEPVLVDYCSPSEGIHCLLCHDTGSNPFSPIIDVTSVELSQNGNIVTSALDPNFDLTLRITGTVLNASYVPITAFKILAYGFSTCTGYPEGLITPTCNWSDDLLDDVQSTADDFTTLFNLTAVDVTGANNPNACNPDGFIQATCPVVVEDGNIEMVLQIKINSFAGGIGSSILNGLETLHDWGMNDIGFITYTLEDEPLFCTRIVAPVESSGATTPSTTTTSISTTPASNLECKAASNQPTCDLQTGGLDKPSLLDYCSPTESLHCLLCHDASPNNFQPKFDVTSMELSQNGNIVTSAIDPNFDISLRITGTVLNASFVPITSIKTVAYGFSTCTGLPEGLITPICDWSGDILSDVQDTADTFTTLFNLTAVDVTGADNPNACNPDGFIQVTCPVGVQDGIIEMLVDIKLNSFAGGVGSYVLNGWETLNSWGMYDIGLTAYTLDDEPLFCTRIVAPIEISGATATTPEPVETTPAGNQVQCSSATNQPTCDLQPGGLDKPNLLDYCSPTESLHCLLCHDASPNNFIPKIDVTSLEVSQNGNIVTTIDPNFDITIKVIGTVADPSFVPITALKYLTFGFFQCTGLATGIIPTCEWSVDSLSGLQTVADEFTDLLNLTAVDVTGVNNPNGCNPGGFVEVTCPVGVEDGVIELLAEIKLSSYVNGVGSSVLNSLEETFVWGMYDFGFTVSTLDDVPLFCTRLVFPLEEAQSTTSSTPTPSGDLQCSVTGPPTCAADGLECTSSENLNCLLCHNETPNFTPKINVNSIQVSQNGNVVTSSLDQNQDIFVTVTGVATDPSLFSTNITSFKYLAFGFSTCSGSSLLGCNWSADLLNDVQSVADTLSLNVDITGANVADACNTGGLIQGNCPINIDGSGNFEMTVQIKINSHLNGLGTTVLDAYELLAEKSVFDYGYTIFTSDMTPLFCTRLVFPLSGVPSTTSTTPGTTTLPGNLQCSATGPPTCAADGLECTSSENLNCLLCHNETPNFTPKINVNSIQVSQNGNVVTTSLDQNQDIFVTVTGVATDPSFFSTSITSFKYLAFGFSTCSGSSLLGCNWSADLLNDVQSVADTLSLNVDITGANVTDACNTGGLIQGNCPINIDGSGNFEMTVQIKINSHLNGLGTTVLDTYELLAEKSVFDYGYTIFTSDMTPLFCTRLVFPLSGIPSTTSTTPGTTTLPAIPLTCTSTTQPGCVVTGSVPDQTCGGTQSLDCSLCHANTSPSFTPKIDVTAIEVRQNGVPITDAINPNIDMAVVVRGIVNDPTITTLTATKFTTAAFSSCTAAPVVDLLDLFAPPTCSWSDDLLAWAQTEVNTIAVTLGVPSPVLDGSTIPDACVPAGLLQLTNCPISKDANDEIEIHVAVKLQSHYAGMAATVLTAYEIGNLGGRYDFGFTIKTSDNVPLFCTRLVFPLVLL